MFCTHVGTVHIIFSAPPKSLIHSRNSVIKGIYQLKVNEWKPHDRKSKVCLRKWKKIKASGVEAVGIMIGDAVGVAGRGSSHVGSLAMVRNLFLTLEFFWETGPVVYVYVYIYCSICVCFYVSISPSISPSIHMVYFKELAHVKMEAISQDMQSASWRRRSPDGMNSRPNAGRLKTQEELIFLAESEDWGKKSNIPV